MMLDPKLQAQLKSQTVGPYQHLYQQARFLLQEGSIWGLIQAVNRGSLFRLLIFVLLFFTVLWLLLTDRLYLYLHPRYGLLMWLFLALLPLLCWTEFPRLLESQRRSNALRYLPFSLPLLCLAWLSFPSQPWPIALERVENPGDKQAGFFESVLSPDAFSASLEVNSGPFGGQSLSDPAEEVPRVSGSIRLGAKDYAAWLTAVLEAPEEFVGKRYTFLGQLDRPQASLTALEAGGERREEKELDDEPAQTDKTRAENEEERPSLLLQRPMVGRALLLCCAADARLVGLYVVEERENESVGGKEGEGQADASSPSSTNAESSKTEQVQPTPSISEIPTDSWAYFTIEIQLEKGVDFRNPDAMGAVAKIISYLPAASPKNPYAYYYGRMEIPSEVEP